MCFHNRGALLSWLSFRRRIQGLLLQRLEVVASALRQESDVAMRRSDRGDYTKVTYLHAKGEQIRYDASRCYSQAFLPLLCGAALRAPIWEGGNPIDQRSR